MFLYLIRETKIVIIYKVLKRNLAGNCSLEFGRHDSGFLNKSDKQEPVVQPTVQSCRFNMKHWSKDRGYLVGHNNGQVASEFCPL